LKDPYFSKNCHGSYECKLCLTLHPNPDNYLAHTQAKKHQTNLRRRAAREQKQNAFDGGASAALPKAAAAGGAKKVAFHKIGRPGYRVTKQFDPETQQRALLFQISYPEIEKGIQPRHRFVSAFVQKLEPPDPKFQYLLFAARPYETMAFKIPALQVERDMVAHKDKIFFDWDRERKVFSLQIMFKKPTE
jgi:splicing factor 3A subunit 2